MGIVLPMMGKQFLRELSILNFSIRTCTTSLLIERLFIVDK